MTEFKFPTEIVELPSKGLVYPQDHPLRSGTIEMKYMTAKEEDILTNQNYISKGIVLDKLLESLTMNKINLKELITGDKNALLVASRILGYGKEYSFTIDGKSYDVDLSVLENKPFNEDVITSNGTLKFILPISGAEIEAKFLTDKDTEIIEQEVNGLKKINKDSSPEITTRLKHQIVSINGSTNKNDIKDFVENHLLARDSRALRNFIKDSSPDVNLKAKVMVNDVEEDIDIPINLNFFWPDL
jgi:hypothetical protein